MTMALIKKKAGWLGVVVLLIAMIWGAIWWIAKTHGPSESSANRRIPVRYGKELGGLQLETWETSRGVSVYFVPVPSIGLVDLRVNIDAGYARDEQQPGISNMVAGLLEEGTASRTADQISDAFDSLGVLYQAECHRDFVSITLRSLADKEVLEPAMRLLADVIVNPTFEPKAIQMRRQRCLTELQKEQQLPDKVAAKAFITSIYGTHPYANARCGTVQSLANIEKAQAHAFHSRYFVADNVSVTIVGGISRAEAEELAENFSVLLPKGDAPAAIPPVPALAQSIKKSVPLEVQQAHVLYGQPCLKMNDEDAIALEVGNYVLGEGSLTTRLFNEIREKDGLAYQVYSAMQGARQNGPCWVGLQTERAQTDEAVAKMQKVVAAFVKDGPTEHELAVAKQGALGGFALQFSDNFNTAAIVSQLQIYQLPLDYLTTYSNKVKKLTTKDVRAAFQKHLDPAKMALIVVGQKNSAEE